MEERGREGKYGFCCKYIHMYSYKTRGHSQQGLVEIW